MLSFWAIGLLSQLIGQVDSSTVSEPDGPRVPLSRCWPGCRIDEVCVGSEQGPLCVDPSRRRPPAPPSKLDQEEERSPFEPPSAPSRPAPPPSEPPPAPTMGTAGNWVVTNDTAIAFGHAWSSRDRGDNSTSIQLSPSASRFFSSHVAVTGGLSFVYGSSDGTETSIISVLFGLRAFQALGDRIGIWPGATAMIGNIAEGPSRERVFVATTFSFPLIIEPVPHFFFGIGPELQIRKLFEIDETDFAFRLPLTIGGWF